MLKLLNYNLIKNKKIMLSEPKKVDELKINRHFPSNTNYWYNSIYLFNKNTEKTMPFIDKIVNNIIRMYFNLKSNVNLNKKFKRRRTKRRRLSSARIFVSKAEVKHSNNKVTINLYTYNRKKKLYKKKLFKWYKRLLAYPKKLRFFRTKKHIIRKHKALALKFIKPAERTKPIRRFKKIFGIRPLKIILKNLRKKKRDLRRNRRFKRYRRLSIRKYFIKRLSFDNLIHLKYLNISNDSFLAYNKFMLRSRHLYKVLRNKKLYNILHLIKTRELPFMLDYYSNNKYDNIFYNEFILDNLIREMLYLNYNQILNTDANKFNNIYLSRLSKLIGNIYKKNIEFNIINLKHMFLDSRIFSESIVLKIKNRKNRLIRILKKSLRRQKLKLGLTYRNNPQKYYINKLNKVNENYNTNYKGDALNFILNNIFNIKNVTNSIEKKSINRYIYRSIRFRKIRGVRIEAKGRLTTRLTASRAISKLRYKGNLSNIDSSVNGFSSVMLRNHVRSNIDYVNLNSKTRNGSFGIKGWLSTR